MITHSNQWNAQIYIEDSCSRPMEILCWTFSDPGSVFYITNVYLTVTEDFWHMIHFSYDQEKLKLLSWHRFSLKTVVHTCGNFVLNLTLSWESFCYYECPYNRNRGHLVYGWKDSVIFLEITAPYYTVWDKNHILVFRLVQQNWFCRLI